MRDKVLSILRDVRMINSNEGTLSTDELLEEIETNAMAALHGDKVMVPSKLFGDIVIPKNVIASMSNGDDDLWFGVSKYIDINISYCGEPQHWQYIIYPVKNGDTDIEHLLEDGKL